MKPELCLSTSRDCWTHYQFKASIHTVDSTATFILFNTSIGSLPFSNKTELLAGQSPNFALSVLKSVHVPPIWNFERLAVGGGGRLFVLSSTASMGFQGKGEGKLCPSLSNWRTQILMCIIQEKMIYLSLYFEPYYIFMMVPVFFHIYIVSDPDLLSHDIYI